jgi:hypothetical protein
MPTPTYTPLANLTLGSAASSVTFSSISGAYRDLIVVFAGTRTGNNNVLVRVNSDTGSNYSYVGAMSNASTSFSSAATSNQFVSTFAGLQTSAQLNVIWQFMDYSATDKHKTVLTRFSQTGSEVAMLAGRWANTAAITSIQVFAGNNDFGSGSTFALYGIVA